MPQLAADVAARIDLVEVPLSLPLSRVLVVRDESDRLGVYQVRYEVPLAECSLALDLVVTDPSGRDREPQVWGASHLRWGADGPVLAVTEDDRVLVGPVPDGWTVRWEPGVFDEPAVTLADAADVDAAVDRAQRLVDEWLARCPQVRPEHRSMTLFCWWVLGVNTIRLGGAASGRAVVPSKLGYVGLWQWDAYFIAIGLRHGDLDLAVEQLRIALEYQGSDGQLPDVVHEAGVLASSDDLPEADLVSLRALGSPALGQGRVPLTKPPLTALTVELVAEQAGPGLIDETADAVVRSQEWWFGHSDLDGDGVPEYTHPYSSGLDDSPVFDAQVPLESPDLTAYLSLQDIVLATWAERRGDKVAAGRHRERAARLAARLGERLDPDGWVRPVGTEGPSPHLTVVSLLAVLAPDAPPAVVDGVVRMVADPARFGGPTPLPTVSRDDAAFAPDRMWRGPVWVNTAWLVARGLRLHGHEDEADALEEALLDLVIDAGGPAEYFNPDTRRRATEATRCFGWSAALFVDLAVRRAGARG